ncbi:hypothetical protein D9Q81_04120 [Candidatus Korarchaeum cryptofilum]|uniref:PKD domain-containing protein n=1 Tax=Candidatus Korarchaeum cryptofilum TaxID=498846 RepID=A0A3R9WYM8_9CREN|nr:hypothetical protein [Candidatus Korarchaeum cryptofilum]RSN69202.1 hypothetical protein D9Q81_04120 [Candidatus Korarchaeum cryptofilum]
MSSRVLIPILLILLPICLPSAQYYLAVEYPISPGFYFAEVNGVKIYDPSQAVYVKPGDIIEGFFDVRVVNVRGGPWITPVIGTASWTRGSFSCITNDAPDGESIQSYHFRLKAPETPGTYYIGIFAGWMYSCEEVASNDHPPQFNDGDDVWDMSQSDWESIISTGKASKYGQPGRAIRIVVSGAPSIQVDVWTDRGGKGVGNLDGGRYRIGESAVFYCSINGDASYLKVWVEKPNGSIVTLFENFNVKAGTYEFKGVMGEPEGERKLKAVACPAGQSCKSEDMLSRDEVRYYVEGGAKLEISHNFPSEVYQGQEFSVSVTVRNSGNIEVRNVASGIWWADDAFKGMGCTGTDKRDSLKPGEYMQYSCKLKAIGSPGTYDVEISAFADGGISASSKFKVRISQVQDREPPKVRVIFPNGGETLYIGEAYKITWEATDNVKVEKVHIWLFQGGRQVSTIVTDNPNTGYFVWIPNMEGKFRIRVAAVDPSGNSAYDDSDSDFNVVPKGAENKPPTAYIDSISPNPAYEGQTIYFSGHGYDPDGSIAECEWKAGERFLSSSCSFSTSLPPGEYKIYFRVKDDKGAWSTWVYATVNVQSRSFTAFVSVKAPSSASPGQNVDIQLSVYYIFPTQTYLAVTISRKLPNGSYEKIWTNSDYNVPKTGGPYQASYTASLSVPTTEGTYNYRATVYYWDGNQWVKTDEKYFDIKVEVRKNVIVYVTKGESLGGWYSFKCNFGAICSENYCELERRRYKFHVVIIERGLMPDSWDEIKCSSRDFDLDLSKFKGNELFIYVEFDEKTCKTWIHTAPGFSVSEASSENIKIDVSGPYEDWFNWFRSLLGWGRIYKYEVTIKNVGGDAMMITSFHTIVDADKFKEVKQILKEAPSQEGKINEAYMKIARVTFGQSLPIRTIVQLVEGAYVLGPEFATIYSFFPAKLPEKIINTINDFASKYPSKAKGDIFISLPTVEVKIHGWGLTKAVAPVVLKPGNETKIEVVLEEKAAKSAAGVRPEFMVTAMTVEMRVDTQGLLPFWEHVANFILSHELKDFHLGWNSASGSLIPP